MLVVFPVGCSPPQQSSTLHFCLTRGRAVAVTTYWMIAAGLVGALVAAPFGLVDARSARSALGPDVPAGKMRNGTSLSRVPSDESWNFANTESKE